MIAYLNGRFLPEEQACVSIHDRGFLYGDGLFETVRIYERTPFLWDEHMNRLRHGCETLRISAPLSGTEMKKALAELLRRNSIADCLARVTLSRGAGPRGYSPRGANYPTLAIELVTPSKPPASYHLISSTIRLPSEDLFAPVKHSSKLRQVMARAEADDVGADEALMMNERGEVVEGTSTNVFWVANNMVCTPPLHGILPGTTREYVLNRCGTALGVKTQEMTIALPDLLKTDGVFVTSAGLEVMEVTRIDGKQVKRSPLTKRLKHEYR